MARIRPARSERRPWPAPAGSWFMQMRWLELCFLHWRVDAEALAPLIPRGLTLDTFDGSAWIGVVPFRMTGVAARAMPRVRQLSDFAELNVRTYVTAGQKPGVWFFSLDATQPLAVRIARKVFHLPYVDARIALTRSGDSITYRSVRTEPGRGEAELGVRYAPTGPAQPGEPGTLEHFLTERYCLYAANAGGGVFRTEVDHPPWPLQPADAEIETNTMTGPLGVALPAGPPLVHYAEQLEVVAWRPTRVTPLGSRMSGDG